MLKLKLQLSNVHTSALVSTVHRLHVAKYDAEQLFDIGQSHKNKGTVITLNIGTLRPATIVVLNIKQFNFTLK